VRAAGGALVALDNLVKARIGSRPIQAHARGDRVRLRTRAGGHLHILAAQFNSFIRPFTIMLSAPRRAAPLCFIGAFAALWISGVSLDIMGQIAFLMLMGVVMKNGILLVDYTNQ
jgi:hypothetical protein